MSGEHIELGGSVFDLTQKVVELTRSELAFTDIHIQEGRNVMVKLPKGWASASDFPVQREDLETFLDNLEPAWRTKIDNPEGSFDKARTLTNVRLRCNAYRCGDNNSISVASRRLPIKVPALGELGLPAGVTDFVRRGKGLILTTGQTGSGKTTTQAALLDYINQSRASHIITIEEPIEYVHVEKRSIFSQREVPTNVKDFKSGLRGALRQKPDVIMVGEIRDRETMETVLHAAESGHLVLATLHTNSAESAITKVLSFFDQSEYQQRLQMLASTLTGIIAQVLVPDAAGEKFVLAYESLNNNQQIEKLIREDKISQIDSVINNTNVGNEDPLNRSLNSVLAEMVNKKVIKPTDAMMATYDQEGLREILRPK